MRNPRDLDLSLALDLADLADSISMGRLGAGDLGTRTKEDRTIVSDADREIEEAIRGRIAQSRPGDAVLGEEFGESGGGDRRWILDPIDATENYVRGIPVFATLIALEEGGSLSVGVVSAPALGRRWWASRGGGATADGRSIRVSSVDRLEEAQLSYSGLRPEILPVARAVRRTRAFGDFWSHMLVAEGAVDVGLDPVASPWDLAAAQIIVEEAGGRLTDLGGSPGFRGGSGISTNGFLHPQVLELLAG